MSCDLPTRKTLLNAIYVFRKIMYLLLFWLITFTFTPLILVVF